MHSSFVKWMRNIDHTYGQIRIVDSFDTLQFTDMTLEATATGGSTLKRIYLLFFKVVPAELAKIQPNVADADMFADVATHVIFDVEMAAIVTAAIAAKWCYSGSRSSSRLRYRYHINRRTHKTITTTTTATTGATITSNKGVVKKNTNCTT
jgi:hypothetical protein